MPQRYIKVAIAFLSIASLLTPEVAASQDAGILYGIKGKFAQCFLAGVVHYNYSWEDSSIQENISRAFEASNMLFTESVSTRQVYKKELGAHIYQKKETKLADVINESIKENDKLFFETLKPKLSKPLWTDFLSFTAFDYSQVVTTIGRALIVYNRELGDGKPNFSTQSYNIANSRGIRASALELPGTHARLSNEFADKEMLVQTITDAYAEVLAPDFIDYESKANQAVRVGDLEKLDSVFRKPFEKYPSRKFVFDNVIAARNISWVAKLEAYLDETASGICFVNVGAAHFLGENGLLALFKKKGYVLKKIATAGEVEEFLAQEK